ESPHSSRGSSPGLPAGNSVTADGYAGIDCPNRERAAAMAWLCASETAAKETHPDGGCRTAGS
ncbi:hypothetical protein, partial [Duodenibacillus massiliensis]|uniref:hypothetical protein n=4 Tax=Duodenibacillus massiliensis TaxID=1852381 RepID=UPI002FD90886